MYIATINASGFKQQVVTEIKIDVGKPSSIKIELEVGSANETVTVVGGGELLQTQSATIGTTLTGRQITDLPNASRDALDLVLTMQAPRHRRPERLGKWIAERRIEHLHRRRQRAGQPVEINDGFFIFVGN
jgi:hypothetical protein